jgi:hypothetical protein
MASDEQDAGEQWLREGLRAQEGELSGFQPNGPRDPNWDLDREEVWHRWKVQQMVRCRSMRFRAIAVELLERRIRGNETEVPPGLHDELDTIVAMDASEQRDISPDKDFGFASILYRNIARELRHRRPRNR